MQDNYYRGIHYPGWEWSLQEQPSFPLTTNLYNSEPGKYKLTEIGLTLVRGKNSNYNLDVGGGTVYSSGTIGNPEAPTVHLELKQNNIVYKSNSVVINTSLRNFYNTNITGANYGDYTNSRVPWDPSNPFGDPGLDYIKNNIRYVFKFGNKPVLITDPKAKVTIVYDSGYLGSKYTCISVGNYWSYCYAFYEEAKDDTKITIDWDSNFTITDKSGTKKSSNNGVLKDYTAELKYIVESGEVIGITFSGNNHVSCVPDIANNKIKIEAKDRNSDYGIKDNITATINGDSSSTINFNVGFFEKVKREERTLAQTLNAIKFIASNINNMGISITSVNYKTEAAKNCELFKNSISDSNDLGAATIFGNTVIPLSQIFTLDSNSNNKYKITEDGQSVPFIFNFYNSDVQTKTSIEGSYSKKLTLNLTIYCAPTKQNEIGYAFLDNNNNDISNSISDTGVILVEQTGIMVGNLRYRNYDQYSGFCRCFKYVFTDEYGNEIKSSVITASQDTNGNSITTGKIISISDLPYNKVMSLTIIPAFYFNDAKSVLYSKTSIKLKQKFIRIDDKALLPTPIFPIVNTTAPYSNMLLPEVERFGFAYNHSVYNNIIKPYLLSSLTFGLDINGNIVELNRTNHSYYSGYRLSSVFICDVGKYVLDHNLFVPELTVKPFVRITYGGINKTIYVDEYNKTECTSLDSLWSRPIAKKGEIIIPYDVDKYKEFLAKYSVLKPLNYEPNVNISTQSGRIINTNLWKAFEAYLNVFAQGMQDFLSKSDSAINPNICWAFTKFTHIKGELITNQNLKQNYYDLLIQLSTHLWSATHHYLNEHEYTHEYLGNFTYNQITNRQGGI